MESEHHKIAVEVAYAKPDRQCILSVEIEFGATIADVIEKSNILTYFPEINLEQQSVGIFSQPAVLSDLVKEGDRVEIYRPLLMDPKEIRRLKAKKSPS